MQNMETNVPRYLFNLRGYVRAVRAFDLASVALSKCSPKIGLNCLGEAANYLHFQIDRNSVYCKLACCNAFLKIH